MEYDIDVKRLITLVEERPAIWDKSLTTTKSRTETIDAWNEIYKEMAEDFHYMNDNEKKHFGKAVFHKWRNIKDSWLKCVKKQADVRETRSRRQYIYFERLQFLKKNLTFNETTNNGFVIQPEDISVEVNLTEMMSPPRSQQPARMLVDSEKRRFEKRKWSQKRRKISEVSCLRAAAPEDRHLSFFKGILPTLHRLNEEQILEFQVGVLNVLKEIRNGRPTNSSSAAQVSQSYINHNSGIGHKNISFASCGLTRPSSTNSLSDSVASE